MHRIPVDAIERRPGRRSPSTTNRTRRIDRLFPWRIADESETETPSFTSAAACRRFSGVIRFSVPSSSFGPHRPQFDSLRLPAPYSALVTCGCADGD